MSLEIEKLNGKREPLADRLPLKVPLSISVTTANICNLRCEFCNISDPALPKNKSLLDFETYKLLVDNLFDCGWHLKQIVLVGLGEPLINPDIVEFVRYTKQKNVADKVHIVTNATLLTYELTDQLLDAGLDVLRISLNGLSDEDYLKYTGRKVDFVDLVDKIRYFYQKKPEAVKLYIKIMDYEIKESGKKEKYKQLFEPISDVANIEYLTEMSTSLDTKGIADVDIKGLKGFDITHDIKVCPMPFYHIYYNAEGTISACCIAGPWHTPPALEMGDLHDETIAEIWNGAKFRKFFMKMLTDGRTVADPVCAKCKAYISYVYPEDNVDQAAEAIKARFIRMNTEEGNAVG